MNNHDLEIFDIMKQKQLDAVIITDGYNMHAISGYKGHTGCMLLAKDIKYIFTDSRYTEQVTIEAPDVRCVDIGRDSYAAAIAKELMTLFIHPDKVLLIGFEDEHISYRLYQAFEKALTDTFGERVKLVALKENINALRIVKTADEIEKLKKAEAIGDLAFSHIRDFIRAGMTEMEIALELECVMRKNGATNVSFDTIVASGPNSSLPHAVPTTRKVTEGDFVTMDFGCIYEGYCSDMTRTIFIGDNPLDKQQEIYNIVLEAQLAALDIVRPGLKCSEVDACARTVIEKAGYGDYFGHGLGHGVGLFIHEEPRFSPKCHDILKPGTVITVEPGIYLPGEFGVRIEDMILITEDGYQNLASSPKELICI